MLSNRNELFPDGWREPGEESERLASYIRSAILLAISLIAAVFSVNCLISPGLAGSTFGAGVSYAAIRWWALAVLVGGGISVIFETKFFIRESAHWKFEFRAERLVAGGFLAGIALFLVGLGRTSSTRGYITAPAQGSTFFVFATVAGGSLCLLSLYVGLFFALIEKVQTRPRKLAGLLVQERYGLDQALVKHDDYPCPVEDGMKPMIVLRSPTGKLVVLQAGADAYDLAEPGLVGVATVRGSHLDHFHVESKPTGTQSL